MGKWYQRLFRKLRGIIKYRTFKLNVLGEPVTDTVLEVHDSFHVVEDLMEK